MKTHGSFTSYPSCTLKRNPQDFLKATRQQAFKLLYLQIILVLVLTTFWFFYQDLIAAWSTILGGIAWIIPNVYFIRKCFTMPSTSSTAAVAPALPWSRIIVGKFCCAEAIKFLLSTVLLVLFIKFLPLKPLPFLSGYIMALVAIALMSYVSTVP